MHYFAYGSNMSSQRLRARVPSAQHLGVYALARHRLRFHKRGADGSAKCDAEATGADGDTVIGVLFDIAESDRPGLDRVEGLGIGYEAATVSVRSVDGLETTAYTYRATDTADGLAPFCWYLHHVLVGAREAGLPHDYIAAIELVNCVRDEDTLRDARERGVYTPVGGVP